MCRCADVQMEFANFLIPFAHLHICTFAHFHIRWSKSIPLCGMDLDHRKAFHKLRGEITFLEVFIPHQLLVEGNRCLDTLNNILT